MVSTEVRKPVGILCNGQLARMTIEAASVMGVEAVAIGSSALTSPAFFSGGEKSVFEGNFKSSADVRRFVDAKDIGSIVLDTDHVETEILHELHGQGLLIVPNPRVIDFVKNRIHQKERIEKAGLPTLPWEAASSDREKRQAYRGLGGDVMFKAATESFDGRGLEHVSSEEQLEQVLSRFQGQDVVVEKFAHMKRELAIMLAQDTHGGRALYPVVQSVHKGGMLEYTFFPSMAGVSRDQQVRELGEGLLEQVIGGAALVGMETIETEDGQLYINEIATRPHNTGHMSIEACETSQFENLVRIANRDHVGQAGLVRPGQMVMMHNLNGGVLGGVTDSDYQTVEDFGGFLHWYGKAPREQTPPRKRGHITLFGQNRDQLMKNAQSAIQAIHFFG